MRKPLPLIKILVLSVAVLVAASLAFTLLPEPSRRHYDPAHGTALSVLFLGDSFTSVNDLPKTVAIIADSLGDRLTYDSNTPGGYGFLEHLKDPTTQTKVKELKWDDIMLQDQSQRPSLEDLKAQSDSFVPARKLVDMIHAIRPGVRTVFFETWAHKNGDGENCGFVPGVCSFDGMQSRLDYAYRNMELYPHSALAPVGDAWAAVRKTHPEIELYQADGIHPTPAGTYLAACVMYATLYNKNVIGADALGLTGSVATTLQQAAQETVDHKK